MRPPASLQWRVALSYTGLILLALGVISYYLFTVVKGAYLSNLETRLTQEAQLLARSAAGHLEGEGDGLGPGIGALTSEAGVLVEARATIIGSDGLVLADSWEVGGPAESRGGRPEVRAALAGAVGQSTRFSPATSQDMMFIAVPIEVNGDLVGVARLAAPTSEIQGALHRIIAAVAFSGLAVAVVSAAAALFLARRSFRPLRTLRESARRLAAGELRHRALDSPLHEPRELARALNSMAEGLDSSIQDLNAERNKLSIVLDTMVDGVMVVGPDRQAVLLNDAARELLGAGEPAGDGTGPGQTAKGVTAAGDPAMRWGWLYPDITRLVEACRTRKTRQQANFELPRPQRVISAVATPLDDGASLPSVLLTLHNLTPMRQIESSQKEFVSNVSHELRNPLASMKAMVETLEDGALTEGEVARDFLRRIHQDIDRMTALGNDLLDLSRLESGQPVLELASVDLLSLVYEVRGQFDALAWAKKIDLQVRAEGQPPRVLGDWQRLRQVLVNLLENALKFTGEGGQVLMTVQDSPSAVTLTVEDTGPGIEAEHLPHVFDRFYKADRARRDGGTGLGLAIVKQIITAHGGDVRAESRENLGSVFRITMPLSE